MVYEGILLGLTLSFMVGPLLFSILQAGLERGFRAGLAVAAGIWVGDVLYVLALHYALGLLTALTEWPHFKLIAGIAGGLLLVAFGVGYLVRPAAKAGGTAAENLLEKIEAAERKPGAGGLSYTDYWLRGFLINLINPFTVFFWIGIATAVVVPNQWGGRETAAFFGGMLGTLVLTDTLKAWAAKRIRQWLTPEHVRLVQRGIGLLLLLFGLVTMVRSALP